MSIHAGPHWLSARAVLPRLAVSLVLVVVFSVLAFAVVLRPALIWIVVAGALLGLLLRFLIKHRARKHDRSSREMTRSERGRRLLEVIGSLALMLVALVVIWRFGVAADFGEELEPPNLPSVETVHRVPYQAALRFQKRGDWSGQEWFMLTPKEAKALVGAGDQLARRLSTAVPSGWSVHPDTTGDVTVYRIQRSYPSHPFDVPRWRPLTKSTSLPAPQLHSPHFKHALFAAKGSTITLRAPEHRILATAPSSSESPEAGATAKRVVTLEVVGAGDAGSGVDVEIESDLATELPQKAVGHGTVALVSGMLGTLGVTFTLGLGYLKRLAKWFKRPRTKSVLRGKASKDAALTSYLEGRGLTAEDVRTAVHVVVHRARELALATISLSSDPQARKKYDAAVRRLTADGKLPELDVVYAALKEAGIADSELDALDTTLDKEIIAAQEST
jgi:hypothetical protein